MSSSLLALFMDFMLAVLLIASMLYCANLSKKIKHLQDGRSELAEMIIKFDAATNRAVASVNDLQVVSKKINDALQLKIDKANFIADDMAFLIEKSNKILAQLEQSRLTGSEQLVQKKPSAVETASMLRQQQEQRLPRTNAERELLAALKGR